MIEERQLRYAGHVWRYKKERWPKFMLRAERPTQKTGKQQQYRKHLSHLLEVKGLNTTMMEDREIWKDKLRELFPRESKETPEENNVEINIEIQA